MDYPLCPRWAGSQLETVAKKLRKPLWSQALLSLCSGGDTGRPAPELSPARSPPGSKKQLHGKPLMRSGCRFPLRWP